MSYAFKTAAKKVENTDLQRYGSRVGGSPYISFDRLDRAAEISYYYGFMPIETPVISRDDITKTRKLLGIEGHGKNYSSIVDCPLYISAEEKVATLRECQEKNLLSSQQPAMIYFENPPRRYDQEKKNNSMIKRFDLEIIGTGKSVAEAELIKTSLEILREEGFEDLYIHINSIGGKECIAKFTKELGIYFKKNIQSMSAHCREELKKDVFAPLECENKKCQEIVAEAPKSVAFLDEPSRSHLREVLEYIESMNIPYKLDNNLVGNRKLCNHTIFEIKSLNVGGDPNEPEKTLAVGYRYNNLAKRVDMKKDFPAVGVTMVFRKSSDKKKCHSPKRPKVYFIQLGFDAKLKSLQVIESLRQAKIPLYQSLSKDKLTSQLATAEHMKIPIVIIMGQKEAIEDSVIVRDMNTRFQETV